MKTPEQIAKQHAEGQRELDALHDELRSGNSTRTHNEIVMDMHKAIEKMGGEDFDGTVLK